MKDTTDYHVLPHEKGWAVRREHAARNSRVFESKEDAIREARQWARYAHASLRVHGQDGRVQEEWTYRDDPFPPRG